MDSKGERKKEIEEKIKVLKAKKHDLVQVLKQVIIQISHVLKLREGQKHKLILYFDCVKDFIMRITK